MQVVLAISSQFTVEMCAASKHCKKFTKNPFGGRGSRSFKVIDVDKYKSLSSVLVMISNTRVPICNHYTRGASGVKITSFRGGTLF